MRLTTRSLPFAAGLFVGVSIAWGAAVAAPDAARLRHDAMEAVGDSFGALREIALKKTPFDAAVVKKNATLIHDKLKEAHGQFPEGSGGGKSRAKAEIWSDRAGFDKSMAEAKAAASAMAAATDEATFLAQMKALGGTCKGCHEKYRLPEQ